MKELNPFAKEIRQFQLNNALPQGDTKNALADIYEANYKMKWGVTKINRGCPSCIGDMMKCLAAEFKVVEFKAVLEKPSSDAKELILEQLKAEAKRRGIKYHHKAGVNKLKELLK